MYAYKKGKKEQEERPTGLSSDFLIYEPTLSKTLLTHALLRKQEIIRESTVTAWKRFNERVGIKTWKMSKIFFQTLQLDD